MKNEKRLIDANELLRDAEDYGPIRGGLADMYDVKWLVDAQITVDAVEVVHGRNLKEDTPSLFECSICHWSCWDTYCGDTDDYNYCPNCGAKMKN